MIMQVKVPVIQGRAVSHIHNLNQARLHQVGKRIVDGTVGDIGQLLPHAVINLLGCQMLVGLLNDVKNSFALARQTNRV